MKFFKFAFLSLAPIISMVSCSAGKHAPEADNSSNTQHSSGVIRLNVFYTVNSQDDYAKAVEIATKLVEASRSDQGCISYDFLQSATVPGEYMIIETWQNDSLLDIHSKAPHFTEFVPQLRAIGEMRTERFILQQ